MNRTLFAALMCGCAGTVLAQATSLADPTRPPIVSTESAGEPAPPAGPTLQSILISPSRRLAVISGQEVAQGGKYGDATVTSITESTVLLRYADRRETLRLLPDVKKRERQIADAAASDKGTAR